MKVKLSSKYHIQLITSMRCLILGLFALKKATCFLIGMVALVLIISSCKTSEQRRQTQNAPDTIYIKAKTVRRGPYVEEQIQGASRVFSQYGSFSNIPQNTDTTKPVVDSSVEEYEAHIEGIDIELWRSGETFLGLFHEYVGTPFDPPAGELDNIQFDTVTNKFSFDVKLSLGSTGVMVSPGRYEASKEHYVFTGSMNPDSITGVLIKSRFFRGKVFPETLMISLKRDNSDTIGDYLRSPAEVELREHFDMVLKLRGPKW